MTSVGYEHLREMLRLYVFRQRPLALIKPVGRIDHNAEFIGVPAAVAPAPTDLLGHVLFALKHEGTNLQILAEALPRISATDVLDQVRRTPNGRYIRLAAYLWESFTGKQLQDLPAVAGPYMPVFDPERYVTAPGPRSQRWRVEFNGLGSLNYCASVRRTQAIKTGLAAGILDDANAFAAQTDRLELDRALSWAYLGETQASFEIERESPHPDKARAFVELLKHAHTPRPLDEEYLVKLQASTISNPFDRAAAFRHEQNWLSSGAPGPLGVSYVPPPPDLAHELMGGLMLFANDRAKHVDPLVAAGCISFGFVFIHPFMDGNGRLSRFLFHHTLCQSGALADGLILPVSIAMAKHEREYLAALKGYSAPTREFWDVRMIDSDTFDLAFTGAPAIYRFWDATTCVEFGFRMASAALEEGLHEQVAFTRRYDQVIRQVNAQFDIRDSILSTLVVSCMQNGGRISINRRKKFANAVPLDAFTAIEDAVAAASAFDELSGD